MTSRHAMNVQQEKTSRDAEKDKREDEALEKWQEWDFRMINPEYDLRIVTEYEYLRSSNLKEDMVDWLGWPLGRTSLATGGFDVVNTLLDLGLLAVPDSNLDGADHCENGLGFGGLEYIPPITGGRPWENVSNVVLAPLEVVTVADFIAQVFSRIDDDNSRHNALELLQKDMRARFVCAVIVFLLAGCNPEPAAPPVVDVAPLADAVVFLAGAVVVSTIIATFGGVLFTVYKLTKGDRNDPRK